MHPVAKQTGTNRRQLLLGAVRWLSLGLFGVLAAGQAAKRRRLADDPRCLQVPVCQACLEWPRCQKPLAREAKAERGRGHPHARSRHIRSA